METQKSPKTAIGAVGIYTICMFILAGLNIAFLLFVINSARTVTLLQQEASALQEDQKMVSSSQDLYQTYVKEIEVITDVFPDEETIPNFIQSFESLIRPYTDEYNVRFVSLTPLVEQEKLYLLLTVIMKTDFIRFTNFLDALEKFPYMTHITSMSTKTPEGFTGKSEYAFGLKIYVKNPFSTE